MKKYLLISLLSCLCLSMSAQANYVQNSPDGRLKLEVRTGNELLWSLKAGQQTLIAPSHIDMVLADGEHWGYLPQVVSSDQKEIRREIHTGLYKKSTVLDHYNTLVVNLKNNVSLEFRVYDNGAAYRWIADRQGTAEIVDETAEFNLQSEDHTYVQWAKSRLKDTVNIEAQFYNPFENLYEERRVGSWSSGRIAVVPMMVHKSADLQFCIFDAAVENYPGMYLRNPDNGHRLLAEFAPYPRKQHAGGHLSLSQLVDEREDYIAKTSLQRSFPWRAVAVGNSAELLESDIAYCLGNESEVKDLSWIIPGKAAWDWWHDWNNPGVGFKSWQNMETYKYYVDFAAEAGLEYFLVDDGWGDVSDHMVANPKPEINIPELCSYAAQKNVGILLWIGMNQLVNDADAVFERYAAMGVKGFKIDFLDRNDQWVVDLVHHILRSAAKHHLVIDFHGIYPLTSLVRQYPHLLNFEGIQGMEQVKSGRWMAEDVPFCTYETIFPFIRMIAGPADYTPGAMRNAPKKFYRSIYNAPMSHGTRTRQLAHYVMMDAPLVMLCDSPVSYRNNKECLDFIASVPTCWDETIALDSQVGEYVIVAKRSGKKWFIGGLTNDKARTVEIDLSFISGRKCTVELYQDGLNADVAGEDYSKTVSKHLLSDKLTVKMAAEGGFTAVIGDIK